MRTIFSVIKLFAPLSFFQWLHIEALHMAPSRRCLIRNIGLICTISAQRVCAVDELFKPNPLTSNVLEQIRIWEQAEADTIKYKGELTGGDVGKRDSSGAYAELLVPILGIAAELESIDRLLHEKGLAELADARRVLQQTKYDKINFKKVFNAYGDNIYYSDPDRANVYLGGGATPKTEQTLAYLQRNEILTNVEDMRAEADFVLKHPEEGLDEMLALSSATVSAMKKYLEVVPPSEISLARTMLKTS